MSWFYTANLADMTRCHLYHFPFSIEWVRDNPEPEKFEGVVNHELRDLDRHGDSIRICFESASSHPHTVCGTTPESNWYLWNIGNPYEYDIDGPDNRVLDVPEEQFVAAPVGVNRLKWFIENVEDDGLCEGCLAHVIGLGVLRAGCGVE